LAFIFVSEILVQNFDEILSVDEIFVVLLRTEAEL